MTEQGPLSAERYGLESRWRRAFHRAHPGSKPPEAILRLLIEDERMMSNERLVEDCERLERIADTRGCVDRKGSDE
jgi:hypothetical protein